MAPEYCIEKAGVSSVKTGDCVSGEEDGLLIMHPRPGIAGWFALRVAEAAGASGGGRVVVHTLTQEQSLCLARLDVWGGPRVLLSEADLFESDGALIVRPRESTERTEVRVLPDPGAPLFWDGRRLEPSADGPFSLYRLPVPLKPIAVEVSRENPGIAEVRLAPGAFDGVRVVILSIEYDGDVGGAFIDGRLIADNFSNGMPWEIGLERFRPLVEEKPICLRISPRREGTLVVRESGMALQQTLKGRAIADIRSVTARAVREARVDARG
jgi:hypothetical protein